MIPGSLRVVAVALLATSLFPGAAAMDVYAGLDTGPCVAVGTTSFVDAESGHCAEGDAFAPIGNWRIVVGVAGSSGQGLCVAIDENGVSGPHTSCGPGLCSILKEVCPRALIHFASG